MGAEDRVERPSASGPAGDPRRPREAEKERTLYAPLYRATSSPMIKTVSSRIISCTDVTRGTVSEREPRQRTVGEPGKEREGGSGERLWLVSAAAPFVRARPPQRDRTETDLLHGDVERVADGHLQEGTKQLPCQRQAGSYTGSPERDPKGASGQRRERGQTS